MIKEAVGKYARQHRGVGHFARVTVQLEENVSEPIITVQCGAVPQVTSQGVVEDVPAEGYSGWKQGAVIGATYALEVAGLETVAVIVSRIQGLTTETNPTVVGAAAAIGVWQALGYSPTPEQIQRIKRAVYVSWLHPYDASPDFHAETGISHNVS